MKKPSFWPDHLVIARNASNWFKRGSAFASAAQILFDANQRAQDPSLQWLPLDNQQVETQWHGLLAHMPCLVCLGYAVELVLKALIVQKDPSVVPATGRINFGTHSLVELAGRAGVAVSAAEVDFLKRLADYLKWGRYPTTQEPSKYKDQFEDVKPYHPEVGFQLERLYSPVDGALCRFRDAYIARHKKARSRKK